MPRGPSCTAASHFLRFAFVAALAASPSAARSDQHQVYKAVVLERGLYQAGSEPYAIAQSSAGPVTMIRNATLVQSTTTILARRFIRFGVRYAITGGLPGAPVNIKLVTRFPEPGLLDTRTGVRHQRGGTKLPRKLALKHTVSSSLTTRGKWYAWFGTSIDVATCSIRPEAEYATYPDRLPDTAPYLWSVMGVGRPIFGIGASSWPLVSSFTKPDGSLGLFYGGTISDGYVIRAIQHLHSWATFLMMDIPPPRPGAVSMARAHRRISRKCRRLF